MNHISTKLTVYAAILLLVPLGIWAVDYEWQFHHVIGQLGEFLWLILLTLTGSVPYAFITILLLTAVAIYTLRGKLDWRIIVIMCLFSQAGTQIIKGSVKEIAQVPRPYVVALHQENIPQSLGYPANSFYAQDKDTKIALIQERAFNTDTQFLVDYHKDELGYSFPSGHTIFAAAWVFLLAGLWHQQARVGLMIFQAGLIVWAMIMAYSRVRLGMHYPIDLFTSILIAWAWHIGLFAWLLPKLKRRFQAA